jgi:hypothetical protein
VTTTIGFDGVFRYELLPAVLGVSNILSRADGNRTWLIVNRVGGTLVTTASTLGTLFGLLYDDQETSSSFGFSGSCQFRAVLSDDFPKTAPRFELKIPAGQSGWMKFFNPTAAVAMFGAVFNANTTAPGFNGGHNLHKLTLTTSSLTIPVFPPSC